MTAVSRTWSALLLTAAGAFPQSANPPEVDTQGAPVLFQSRVHMVMVPVVVRDPNGRAVEALTREQFQLFDNGKPQEISGFSVERFGGTTVTAAGAKQTGTAAAPPDRFIAYLFDDLHLKSLELMGARDAASHQLAELQPNERAAIFAMSGDDPMPQFTADSKALSQSLRRLHAGGSHRLDVAAALRTSLASVTALVERLSAMPGQRVVVLVSPGFMAAAEPVAREAAIDRAVKAGVVINTVDARGLFGDPKYKVDTFTVSIPPMMTRSATTGTKPAVTTGGGAMRLYYDEVAKSAVLVEVSAGTGGKLFQNSNDLTGGFRQLASAPETYYVLGFSPQNLKLDGARHVLRVSLKPAVHGAEIEARRAYYAPNRLADAAATAREEIREAVFSREEASEVPVTIETEARPSGAAKALGVVCRVDIRHLQFQKSDGRNRNRVKVVTSLFDHDGNLVSAFENTLTLQLKDETLAILDRARPVPVRTEFPVAPGNYTVRVVVRDDAGQSLTALNRTVTVE